MAEAVARDESAPVSVRPGGPGEGPAILQALRALGAEAFSRLGLPTGRNEEWKYTSLAPLEKLLSAASTGSPADGRGESLETLPPLPATLTFVDGALTGSGPIPEGVTVMGLSAAAEALPHLVKPHLGGLAATASHPVAALGSANLTDGAFVYVGRGAAPGVVVHLLFRSRGRSGPAVFPRTLVVVEGEARLTLVESYVGPRPGAGAPGWLVVPVTEVVVGPGAAVDHTKLCDGASWHVGLASVRLDRDSKLSSHLFALSGQVARHELQVALSGEGSEVELEGLTCVSTGEHADAHTLIDHVKPHATSRELYKGILAGTGRAVFDGKVIVRPNAVKTNAQQSNKNLVLSDGAIVDSKPQLEILNNDVKCTHGSTTGRLDEAATFYLRSRGLSAAQARSLLTYAFASELVDRAPEALREHLRVRIHAFLPAEGRSS